MRRKGEKRAYWMPFRPPEHNKKLTPKKKGRCITAPTSKTETDKTLPTSTFQGGGPFGPNAVLYQS